MKTFFKIIACALLTTRCVSIHSVSLTQIPVDRSSTVTASDDKWIIFFFTFSNDFVDNVTKELRTKCPNKQIRGILTKNEQTNYFLGLVMKDKVTATGYCVS